MKQPEWYQDYLQRKYDKHNVLAAPVEGISFDALRNMLQVVLSETEKPDQSETPEATAFRHKSEAGQIVSILRRSIQSRLSREKKTKMPNEMADKILSASDFHKLNITNIGEKRLETLQSALQRLPAQRK